MNRHRRPCRASHKVRAHLMPGELGAATAPHPRPSRTPYPPPLYWRAQSEVKLRVPNKLLYTDPTPTPAAFPRYTSAAER